MNPLCIPWNHQTSQRVPPISFTVKKSAKKWPSFGDQRASALHDVPLRCATLAPFLLGGAVKPYETWRKRMAPMGLCIKYIPTCYSQVLNPFYDGNNPNDTIISIMFLGALGASGRPGGQHAQAGRSSPQWHCAPAPAWSEKKWWGWIQRQATTKCPCFFNMRRGLTGLTPNISNPKISKMYSEIPCKFHEGPFPRLSESSREHSTRTSPSRVHQRLGESPAGTCAGNLHIFLLVNGWLMDGFQ